MEDSINKDRRRFLGVAAKTVAAAQFGAIDPGTLGGPAPPFGALKHIDAGVLNVGYAEVGRLEHALTARAECYLVGHPDAFPDSVRRLQAYAEAGADVPG